MLQLPEHLACSLPHILQCWCDHLLQDGHVSSACVPKSGINSRDKFLSLYLQPYSHMGQKVVGWAEAL